jgi:hypothetical protein
MRTARLRSVMRFVLASRGVYFIGAFAFLLLLAGLSTAGIKMATTGEFWTNHLDPFVGMAVLIVAMALWFGEVRQDWRASLPCRLTVVFCHSGDGKHEREVMRCERAGLASESDMRALGQQIGAQMVGERQLDFCAPSVKQLGGHIEETGDGIVYRHYTVELRLRRLPSAIADLAEDEFLVWRSPFTDEPIREKRS